jgi:hypothetical protein
MGGSDRTTILDRLLEMVRGSGGTTSDRPEGGSREAKRNRRKIARKKSKKERGLHQLLNPLSALSTKGCLGDER